MLFSRTELLFAAHRRPSVSAGDSLPGVIGIAIDGMVGKGGMRGVIRYAFTGRRGMGLCGRS